MRYTISILSGRKKTFAGLRMPTDAEWADLMRAQKMLRPRGALPWRADPGGEAAAAKLLGRLTETKDALPEFDGAEASLLLQRLADARVVGSTDRETEVAMEVTITTSAHGVEQDHKLRMWTIAELRAFSSEEEVETPNAKWTNLLAFGRIYDKLAIEVPAEVPVTTKRVVIEKLTAIYGEMAAALGETAALAESSSES